MKEAVKYWQHWLIGKQFTIYSDHKPLENMNIKCRTDEELGDPNYYLSLYNFTVKYIPGKESGNRLNRKKLDELKIGPLKIAEKISNSIYRIDTGNRKTESTLFHITKLQPVTIEAEEDEVEENKYEDN
ncbi:hypothetical protein EVAR_60467_1 [Eumeta japonica]|uniref:Reverse transcriptase RNase H-like domain-containing protein n=1 Tax=Eumeta variegata TaxID=151549 RepID=A0A4C1ZMM5_EUMVA|nr:hypothetical protein EVAR_60467_1 [Eumeta japonica]